MRALILLLISTALIAGEWRKPTARALDRYSMTDEQILVCMKGDNRVRPALVIKNWDKSGGPSTLVLRIEGLEVPLRAVECWQAFPKAPRR